MSRILVDQIRSNSASADAMTLDGSGNVTFPANVTCSGTATGMGGGKILQVITNSGSSNITTSGGAKSDLTNVSITPASASNKVLLIASCTLFNTASGNSYGGAYLHRGTSSDTVIYTAISGFGTATDIYFPFALTLVDSPNTTSAQTYTFSFSRQSVSTTSVSTNSNNYSLTALEIAA